MKNGVVESNYLSFVRGTTAQIKNLLIGDYTYKVFAFVDFDVPCVGISLPIWIPTNQSGCIQICSKFDGLDNVFARKFLDGVWYGEW